MNKIKNCLIVLVLTFSAYGFGFVVGLLTSPQSHRNSPNLNDSPVSHDIDDFVPDTPEKVDLLVSAIYRAEGSEKATFPYGIRSVKCDSLAECKRVCQNTVRNQIKRWEKAGKKEPYLVSLRNRYCPLNADNDPKGLNSNWLRLVKYFLRKKA